MRIAGFADCHLLGPGVPGASQAEWRQGDFLRSVNVVGDEIIAWKPDLTLFAGDAFQSRNPSQRAIYLFMDIAYRLSMIAPLVIIAGNHDLTSAGSVLKALELHDNIYYIETPHAIEFDGAQVFGMPWIHYSHQKAKSGEPKDMEEAAQVGIRAFLAQPFDGPRVFVGHLTMLGADYNFGPAAISLGREIFWQPSWLDGFDAALLGHLHKHQFPDPSRKWLCYAGSTERLDFGERDQQKGWVSIDLGDEEPEWEFHPVYSRPMVEVEYPFPEVPEDAIVKPIIQLKAGEPMPDIQIECRHVMPPVILFEEKERQWRGPKDMAGRPIGEQLEIYFDSRGIEPERQKILMDYAQEIVNE